MNRTVPGTARTAGRKEKPAPPLVDVTATEQVFLKMLFLALEHESLSGLAMAGEERGRT